MRYLTLVFATIGMVGALLLCPIAAAAPVCTKIGPMTTQCETPGHSQITTSPPAMNVNPWWPYGGFPVGFPW